MEFFPNMRTFLEINFGNFHLTIAWYAVIILTGALLAYAISIKFAKKCGYDEQILENFFLTMLPIAFIGARIWYVIFEWQRYASNPISALYIWEGGLAIQGGLIAAVIYAYFYFRRYGMNLLRVGDCIMPNVLLAQAIGRWGNFMNQEAYGQIVSKNSLSWLPDFISEKMKIDGYYRQPMFLYESMGNLIGWFLITFIYRKKGYKKRGDLVYAYFCWYGLVRFFVEIFRSDSLMLGSIKVAQLISIIFIVLGVLGLFGVYNKLFANYWPFAYNKPTVIFDFDGTLANSFPIIEKTFKHIFKTYPIKESISDDDIKSFFGPPLKDTFERYYPNDKVDEIIKEYRKYNHAIHSELKAQPHAIELLKFLKDHNYEIAVVSSKGRESLLYGLDTLDMRKYFKVIVAEEDVTKHKPNPEGILKATQLLNVGVDDLIYIGDTLGDIKAAKAIGAYSIAYGDDKSIQLLKVAHPCACVTDLKDIIKLLEEDEEWNDLTA